MNGFNQMQDDASKAEFALQAVTGMNEAVDIINTEDISKSGVGLYSALFKRFLPKAAILKNKPLLIIGKTVDYVDLKALTKNGIEYKVMSFDDYSEMSKADLAKYCLMYFAFNSYTEISIFDLETDSMVYTRHFASGKREFSGGDIREIADLWQ